MSGGKHRDEGFALVTVLWGLALVALLATAFITAARWRVRASANILASSQAELLAEAGVNIAILHLLSAENGHTGDRQTVLAVLPLLCHLPNGGMAALSAEDEGGKVDLNAAPPALLAAALLAAGTDKTKSTVLAAAIMEFRSAAPGTAEPPARQSTSARAVKHGLFQTIYELDQVPGIDAGLFRALLPFVTVHSRQPGIDPGRADPALLAALGENPAQPAGISGAFSPSSRRAFLVRAEVLLPGKSVFAREALVEIGQAGPAMPFVIHEWRTGRSHSFSQGGLQYANPVGLPQC